MAYKRISPQPVVEGGTGAATLTGVLTGNGTSAITGNAVTQYTVLLGDSSNAVTNVSGVGTSSQVLTSNGAGVAPTWQNAGTSSSGLDFIETQTGSGSTDIQFTSSISSTGLYKIVGESVQPGTAGASLLFELSSDNGSSWLTSDYHGGLIYNDYNSSSISNSNSTSNQPMSNACSVQSQHVFEMIFKLVSGDNSYWNGNATWRENTTQNTNFGRFGGRRTNAAIINAIRFRFSSGTITGTIHLYEYVQP